jgi:hypothetical protein
MTEQEHGSVAMGDSILETALDAYWDAAYQQGQDGRDHDDKDCTAEKAEYGLRAAIAALSARPVQEPVAWISESELEKLKLRQSATVMPSQDRDDFQRPLVFAAPQPAHGTSATERATPAPADHALAPVTAGQGVEAGLQAELAAIRKSVRNAMGAIESNQVADKDVHGTLKGVLKRLDALSTPTPKEESK